MIGASLRALLALFAILTATAVIAPAYAERVAAPSRPDPAGAAVEALIASAKGEMLANPEQAAAQALAAERRIRSDPAVPDRAIALATAQWLQGEAYVRLNELDRARPLTDHAWSTRRKRAPPSQPPRAPNRPPR